VVIASWCGGILGRPEPCDVDATEGLVSEFLECSRREVEVGDRAGCASVGDRDLHALASIASGDHLVAERVVVGVHAVIAWVGIEKELRGSSNILAVVVGDTTRAETSLIVCALTRLGANHVARLAAVAR